MRSRLVTAGLVAILVVSLAVAALLAWTRPRVVEAGSVVVLIAARDLTWDRRGDSGAGVGIGGRLGLVGGRCVGFAGDGPDLGKVIVWAAGTEVRGEGSGVRIRSGDVEVGIGDSFEGGSQLSTTFDDFADRVPEECRGLPMVDVSLGS